jgi:hypothetical protein
VEAARKQSKSNCSKVLRTAQMQSRNQNFKNASRNQQTRKAKFDLRLTALGRKYTNKSACRVAWPLSEKQKS